MTKEPLRGSVESGDDGDGGKGAGIWWGVLPRGDSPRLSKPGFVVSALGLSVKKCYRQDYRYALADKSQSIRLFRFLRLQKGGRLLFLLDW